jgi:transposase
LVFIDECGFSLDLHRKYGWTIGGGRCFEVVPVNTGQNRSVVGAYSWPSDSNPTGLWALWQKLGAWNRECFELFLCDGLLPLLPPGSVLVMDNASIHKGTEIESMVTAAGCSLLYLPPYSPDFNPIEPVWSWLKHQVRIAKPENDDARQKAIRAAEKLLPATAAPGWFKYSGLC